MKMVTLETVNAGVKKSKGMGMWGRVGGRTDEGIAAGWQGRCPRLMLFMLKQRGTNIC